MKARILAAILILSAFAIPLLGCGSNDTDANYTTEIKLTDAEKQKLKENSALNPQVNGMKTDQQK
jgi:hypothetical protein